MGVDGNDGLATYVATRQAVDRAREGGGATLLVDLAARLGERIGPVGSWLFLIGAAGAVFSSLLGV